MPPMEAIERAGEDLISASERFEYHAINGCECAVLCEPRKELVVARRNLAVLLRWRRYVARRGGAVPPGVHGWVVLERGEPLSDALIMGVWPKRDASAIAHPTDDVVRVLVTLDPE